MKTMRKFNRKRGFTLVETVVAMALIAIASVVALVLYFNSEKAVQSAHDKQQANFYVSDVISCYRDASTFEEFKNNVAFALGIDESKITVNENGNAMEIALDKGFAVLIEWGEGFDRQIDVGIKYGENVLAKGAFIKGGVLE